ncbi:MAG TPA: hypothetical protein VK821_04810, partial [Dehalococcoidia bacterium]|nr:hypothetical protein [Dehalococcoidia bacterium]
MGEKQWITPVESHMVSARQPKPEWLKVRMPGGAEFVRLTDLMREQSLHTVCEEAHCP